MSIIPNKYHPGMSIIQTKYHPKCYISVQRCMADIGSNLEMMHSQIQYNTNRTYGCYIELQYKNMYYSKEKKNTLHTSSEYVNIKNKEMNNKLLS
ncbi:hypothetical protein PFDG_04473 [Plasmodium falciparum Dd2]|uniref:Uncharacterized protein n=1 Tax=Plasmodium falciparum (isolate Dd2) TaxID=57267 RepID=A0A0L7M8L7_PLAF4|nr:hypothetical protein PFDG_04473 [Plasmodium falciparum Dd2]